MILGEEDRGILHSIISNLEMRMFPSQEFTIRFGEIGQNMFFIISGRVVVISSEGVHLAVLSPGKYYGEMALVSDSLTRKASVRAITDLSCALMTKESFNEICSIYSVFKTKMLEVAEKRTK